MPSVVVVGAQWGDEGKGKITDLLAEQAALVLRYQGGTNAGHTVNVGGEVFKLHLIPSGILHRNVTCAMGDGTLIDPVELAEEISGLKSRGHDCDNLIVSGNAHVIMPYHCLLDGLTEDQGGSAGIGTTRRGIGPAYNDKLGRVPRGLRMWDLLDPDIFRARVEEQMAVKNRLLTAFYGHEPMDVAEVMDGVTAAAAAVRRHIGDLRPLVREALAADAFILLEGAQGTFLDPDYGTYPHVTSSHPVSGGACLGTGVPPTAISRVIMVAKAYTTRVGRGPFPTELTDSLGEALRERGGEYGTTTGRPRRCGWFDAVIVRGAAGVNGATELAITKLDVLDTLDRISLCVGYKIGGEVLEFPPGNLDLLDRVEPVCEEMPGWKQDISRAASIADLPARCRAYLDRLQDLVGVPIGIVSVGAEREQTLFC
jgi:adenylosuccinate synthase